MPTLCKAYADPGAARDAIDELLTAGRAGPEIRMVVGSMPHDRRQEIAGGFAKPVAPDATVGRFAGTPLRRWRGEGSFAGEADLMRKGSFADVDADAIVTFAGHAERARIAGDREVRHLLRRSEFNREVADELVEELHAGRELVLIDVTSA
jgi:hypothetical protein